MLCWSGPQASPGKLEGPGQQALGATRTMKLADYLACCSQQASSLWLILQSGHYQ